jgi:hypothetical protein
MDPNAALERIRAASMAFSQARTNDAEHDAAVDALSAFADLDEWLQTGGFLPSDWDEG